MAVLYSVNPHSFHTENPLAIIIHSYAYLWSLKFVVEKMSLIEGKDIFFGYSFWPLLKREERNASRS